MNKDSEGTRIFVSYQTLRRVVGILGVLLPVFLAVGCFLIGSCTELQDSISAYYGTAMRNVFVGILFTIGWFLFSYRGYDHKDNIFGDLACLFAMGVALFPITSNCNIIRTVHFVSAAGLFLVLAYFSLFLFTKTAKDASPSREKKIRNKVYTTCGLIMLVCIAWVALYYAFLQEKPVAAIKPVFWLESLALWAFGWSWFIKGETFWTDIDNG